jgi:phage host-nuclease inhibitor protein Gam
MEELELAIRFLKRRAVLAEKIDNKVMRQWGPVLSLSEVEAVLEMVNKNEFIKFYNRIKEQGHRDCI